MTVAFRRIAVIVCWFCLATSTHAEGSGGRLFRTSIHGRRVRSVSGDWLTVPISLPEPVRAWSGILIDSTGGPSLRAILERHQGELKQRLVDEETAADERAARIRHLSDVRPQYFDVVLLQFSERPACCCIVDYNVDRKLGTDSPMWVASTEANGMAGPRPRDALQLTIDVGASLHPLIGATPPAGTGVSDTMVPGVPVPPVPREASEMQRELLRLDGGRVRKQQLRLVVEAADKLIAELDRITTSDRYLTAIADALYRRGRALGYMELPDVLEHTPVQDQAWLDREFEATCSRLAQLVDMQQPQYVLLSIRRERRAGRRGRALDLLDAYAATHPNPVWHHKKRVDLMRELKVTVPAHQAAARLWLFAHQPLRSACCIYRSSSGEVRLPQFASSDGGGSLRQVNDETWEAVRWIPQSTLREQEPTEWHLQTERTVRLSAQLNEVVLIRGYTASPDAE